MYEYLFWGIVLVLVIVFGVPKARDYFKKRRIEAKNWENPKWIESELNIQITRLKAWLQNRSHVTSMELSKTRRGGFGTTDYYEWSWILAIKDGVPKAEEALSLLQKEETPVNIDRAKRALRGCIRNFMGYDE